MQQTNREGTTELIREVYAAVTTNDGWDSVLGEVTHQLKADGSFFCARDASAVTPIGLVSSGINTDHFGRYRDHYHKVDILNQRVAKLPRGRLYRNTDIVSDEEYLASEIYQGWHQPHDIRYTLLGCIEDGLGQFQVDCGIIRGHSEAPFAAPEVQAANELLPHLARGLQLAMQLGQADGDRGNAYAALDQLEDAIAVCSHDGKSTYQNQAFLRLASSSRLFRSQKRGGEKLKFREKGNEQLFKQLLQQTMDPVSESIHTPYSNTVCIQDNGDQYLLKIQPWISSSDTPWGIQTEPGYILFIRKAGKDRVPSARTLAALHPLTISEAEIGHYLCKGMSAEDVAIQRGVAPATVRQQIKSMMRKLNCHKQGELVSYLLTHSLF